ncbi:MAG: Holliday junction branch migration protein RuvA [Elusimicrobiales bacterium]|nr:Holliday junction branch migration protein RuvA [Elusimicrobiales bacterium]
MIAYLRGTVVARNPESAVIETAGVGYEVFLCGPSLEALGPEGSQAQVFVAESISMYGGTALYGFLSREEKLLFDLLRDAVPNTGAKKALDYLGKAMKSLPDFTRAVAARDPKPLTVIFGFTAKTAEKLIAALKDKLPASGLPSAGGDLGAQSGSYLQAMSALTSLGFRAADARAALEEAAREAGPRATAEAIIRLALKRLSPK